MTKELKGHCCEGCYETVICYKSGHYNDCGHLAQERASKKHPFLKPAMKKTIKTRYVGFAENEK